MAQNRKRGRNVMEDEVEFMPLSKRINNLHINGILMEKQNVWGPGPPSAHFLPESPPPSESSVEFIQSYTPDLDEQQNPHYFNINRLLYEMYLGRLQRGYHG